MTATVVLVHGGWAGPWIWQEVVDRLADRGVPVRAPQLPSANATAPTVDFRTDAGVVREAVAEAGGDVVLAGNSYGGLVITEAAVDNPSVKRLVYLAAFMPDAGEAIFELLSAHSAPEFGAAIELGADGLMRAQMDTLLERAMQHAPPEQVELARANLGGAMSFGSDFAAKLTQASWRTIPSTYVVCTEDRALKPESQRTWAKERATDYVEWPSDHCPQSSRPDDVADLLAKLANDIT